MVRDLLFPNENLTMENKPMEEYVNITQAAELLNSDRNFLKRHIAKKTIEVEVKMVPRYKIAVSELEKLKKYRRK